MILHLAGEVEHGMVDKLVDAINDLNPGEKLSIYLTTPEGGSSDTVEAIVDIVNKNKSLIEMVFYGEIFSSGMYIFLKVQCPKYVLNDTRGMFHFAWQEMQIREGGKPSQNYDKFCMKEMKVSEKATIEFLKTLPLTDKEINGIKKGYDVYFSNERLRQIIDGTK